MAHPQQVCLFDNFGIEVASFGHHTENDVLLLRM